MLLGLLAVIAVVVLIVTRPGSHGGAQGEAPHASAASAAPSASHTSSTAATATPTASSTPTPTARAAGQPCQASDIDIEALTDASHYGSDQQPLLSFSITNTGSVMCTIDVGTAVQVYTISSGSDVYWRSTDCQKNPEHTEIKLQPNKTLTSTPIAWDRTRSSTTTCSGKRPAAPAGGSSYHLKVTVDGIASRQSKQFLLDG